MYESTHFALKPHSVTKEFSCDGRLLSPHLTSPRHCDCGIWRFHSGIH